MTASADAPETTLVERRGQMDFLFLFLAGIAALVAWRGWDGARVAAIVAGIAAVVLLGAWIRWRLLPTPELRIGRDAIWYGRPGSAGKRIERGATGRLRFEQAHKRSGWLLVDADQATELFFLGFDLPAIQAAAEQHGWTFGPEAPASGRTIGPCAVCGTALEEGRPFCGDCGAYVWVACPSCGTENRNGAAACERCGTALPQPPVTQRPPFDSNVQPARRPFTLPSDERPGTGREAEGSPARE